MKNEFSTLEVCKALRIPRERFRDWMDRGFIKPTVPAEGQGTKALFTRNDVYHVALFSLLIKQGHHRSRAAEYIRVLAEEEERNTGRVPKFLIAETVDEFNFPKVCYEDEEKRSLVLEGYWDTMLIINYQKIIEKTNPALSGL